VLKEKNLKKAIKTLWHSPIHNCCCNQRIQISGYPVYDQGVHSDILAKSGQATLIGDAAHQ
jgi:hypothetical protein